MGQSYAERSGSCSAWLCNTAAHDSFPSLYIMVGPYDVSLSADVVLLSGLKKHGVESSSGRVVKQNQHAHCVNSTRDSYSIFELCVHSDVTMSNYPTVLCSSPLSLRQSYVNVKRSGSYSAWLCSTAAHTSFPSPYIMVRPYAVGPAATVCPQMWCYLVQRSQVRSFSVWRAPSVAIPHACAESDRCSLTRSSARRG